MLSLAAGAARGVLVELSQSVSDVVLELGATAWLRGDPLSSGSRFLTVGVDSHPACVAALAGSSDVGAHVLACVGERAACAALSFPECHDPRVEPAPLGVIYAAADDLFMRTVGVTALEYHSEPIRECPPDLFSHTLGDAGVDIRAGGDISVYVRGGEWAALTLADMTHVPLAALGSLVIRGPRCATAIEVAPTPAPQFVFTPVVYPHPTLRGVVAVMFPDATPALPSGAIHAELRVTAPALPSLTAVISRGGGAQFRLDCAERYRLRWAISASTVLGDTPLGEPGAADLDCKGLVNRTAPLSLADDEARGWGRAPPPCPSFWPEVTPAGVAVAGDVLLPVASRRRVAWAAVVGRARLDMGTLAVGERPPPFALAPAGAYDIHFEAHAVLGKGATDVLCESAPLRVRPPARPEALIALPATYTPSERRMLVIVSATCRGVIELAEPWAAARARAVMTTATPFMITGGWFLHEAALVDDAPAGSTGGRDASLRVRCEDGTVASAGTLPLFREGPAVMVVDGAPSDSPDAFAEPAEARDPDYAPVRMHWVETPPPARRASDAWEASPPPPADGDGVRVRGADGALRYVGLGYDPLPAGVYVGLDAAPAVSFVVDPRAPVTAGAAMDEASANGTVTLACAGGEAWLEFGVDWARVPPAYLLAKVRHVFRAAGSEGAASGMTPLARPTGSGPAPRAHVRVGEGVVGVDVVFVGPGVRMTVPAAAIRVAPPAPLALVQTRLPSCAGEADGAAEMLLPRFAPPATLSVADCAPLDGDPACAVPVRVNRTSEGAVWWGLPRLRRLEVEVLFAKACRARATLKPPAREDLYPREGDVRVRYDANCDGRERYRLESANATGAIAGWTVDGVAFDADYNVGAAVVVPPSPPGPRTVVATFLSGPRLECRSRVALVQRAEDRLTPPALRDVEVRSEFCPGAADGEVSGSFGIYARALAATIYVDGRRVPESALSRVRGTFLVGGLAGGGHDVVLAVGGCNASVHVVVTPKARFVAADRATLEPAGPDRATSAVRLHLDGAEFPALKPEMLHAPDRAYLSADGLALSGMPDGHVVDVMVPYPAAYALQRGRQCASPLRLTAGRYAPAPRVITPPADTYRVDARASEDGGAEIVLSNALTGAARVVRRMTRGEVSRARSEPTSQGLRFTLASPPLSEIGGVVEVPFVVPYPGDLTPATAVSTRRRAQAPVRARVLRAPDPLTVVCALVAPASGPAAADGEVSATAAAGTPPYIYTWSDGNGTLLSAGPSTRTGLRVGAYIAHVSDGSDPPQRTACAVEVVGAGASGPAVVAVSAGPATGCAARANVTLTVEGLMPCAAEAAAYQNLSAAPADCGDARFLPAVKVGAGVVVEVGAGAWFFALCQAGVLTYAPADAVEVADPEVLAVTVAFDGLCGSGGAWTAKSNITFTVAGAVGAVTVTTGAGVPVDVVTVGAGVVSVAPPVVPAIYTYWVADARACPVAVDVTVADTGAAPCGGCDMMDHSCDGCDGVPDSGMVFDDCGVCGGGDACFATCVIGPAVPPASGPALIAGCVAAGRSVRGEGAQPITMPVVLAATGKIVALSALTLTNLTVRGAKYVTLTTITIRGSFDATAQKGAATGSSIASMTFDNEQAPGSLGMSVFADFTIQQSSVLRITAGLWVRIVLLSVTGAGPTITASFLSVVHLFETHLTTLTLTNSVRLMSDRTSTIDLLILENATGATSCAISHSYEAPRVARFSPPCVEAGTADPVNKPPPAGGTSWWFPMIVLFFGAFVALVVLVYNIVQTARDQ